MREDSFSYRQLDSLPIGAVIESPANLDEATGGKWLRLAGQYATRSGVAPAISKAFPFGKPTITVRTLAATPNTSGAVVATPTYFVAPAATGTSSIQYSPDGATWSQTSVSTASGVTYGLLWAGSRLFRLSSSAEGIQYTSGDNPGSTWTSVTGSFPAGYGGRVGAAYSPSLGRTVFPNAAADTNIYSVDDGGGVAVARTKASSQVDFVCWTGRRFIARSRTVNLLHFSDDGITWTSNAGVCYPEVSGGIASDGAGTVVMCSPASGAFPLSVSKDHGDTWQSVSLRPEMYSAQWGNRSVSTYSPRSVEYRNGWFVITPVGGAYWFAVSKNGLEWTVVSTAFELSSGAIDCSGGVAVKGDTWVLVGSAATSLSFTVDYSKMRLPFPMRTYNSAATLTIGNQWDQWMKVRH